ncbi:hypothetical protein [Microvirga terrestris]|uniref:Uncharacterized protein n=1 Tax=Microvirga terrestris TaxID=2791024 RepID=A0ABS0HWP9_9HYPH|nr:hypothetical protein [Microvirga terrestris]MBF9197890.1 hypothetical protein [Microvirga terrestris]
MARFKVKVIGFSGYLLALLCIVPAQASPFFVTIYGRTYKVDPRVPANEPKGIKPQEVLQALPDDIARGPGFRPSHEQVLAEVEERTWIVSNELSGELAASSFSSKGQYAGADKTAVDPEITGSLANGTAQAREPKLQTLYDRHRALSLLGRELRRSMDLPEKAPDAEFSRPKLSFEVEASYRNLNFDPLAAYYSFRRVKAAFRSGDIQLLARVTHYPISITRKAKRMIRNREQLIAAKDAMLSQRLREVAARSTFETVFVRDKGMMLGEGEIWITKSKTGFGLGAISTD